jgi:2-C-methyl-D-erythritol 4-phosphate cytidylyltransferase
VTHSDNGSARCEPAKPSTPCWAIILGGGSGARLNSKKQKAFVPLVGKPMLAWSLLAFAAHPRISDIMVVVPEGAGDDFIRQVIAPIKGELSGLGTCIHEPVVGGPQRQDSARIGLAKILSLSDSELTKTMPVLIHDAARPLVQSDVIDRLLVPLDEAGAEAGPVGVIPALPVADTLKQASRASAVDTAATSDDNCPAALSDRIGLVDKTIPRDNLYQIQTPQAFHLMAIFKAHQAALDCGFQGTDDAMLFEEVRLPVVMVPGSRLSLKVTYPQDLELVESLLIATAARSCL